MINNDPVTIRATAALTGSYVTTDPIQIQNASQLYVYADYTKGDETQVDLLFELSPDDALWGPETAVTISSGVGTWAKLAHKATATGVYIYELPVMGLYFRASAKATAGTPTGTLKLVVQPGNA